MRRAGQPRRGVVGGLELATRPRLERGEEPAWRRLDGPAVEAEDGRPGGTSPRPERIDQRGLADPGDPVDEDDERAALAEQLAKDGHLVVAADQPTACSSISWRTVRVIG